jgi:Protein of unknown function (DUF998)
VARGVTAVAWVGRRDGLGGGIVEGQAVRTRALLACGAVGGPLFVVAFLVEGATRTGYDPVRYPVSLLAVGDFGWEQIANFIVTGLLMLAFAVGLRRAPRPVGGSVWGPLLVGIYAIGLLGAGVFVTDPVAAIFPPGTPHGFQPSLHSTLPDVATAVVVAALPTACLVFSRRFATDGRRGWAIYSAGSGVVFLVGFVLAGVNFAGLAGAGIRRRRQLGGCRRAAAAHRDRRRLGLARAPCGAPAPTPIPIARCQMK